MRSAPPLTRPSRPPPCTPSPLLLNEKVEKNEYGYVTSGHSLTHEKDKITMETMILSAWVMLGTEDLPEWLISLIYLYQRGSEADPFFWFSLGTTTIHALRQIFEIYHTGKFRPLNDFLRKHMRCDGARKAFEVVSNTLQTYGKFVSELVLAGCRGYTADQFESLFQHLTSAVTIIDLSECIKLTDTAVIALANGCPRITTIYLYGCEQLTNDAVIALANGCPHITTIDLNGCSQLTPGAAKDALRSKGITVED